MSQGYAHNGPPGATGAPGPQGTAGVTGSQGPQGSPGVTGAMGIQGPQGSPGSPGPTGSIGATGVQGIQGSAGITGVVGPQGSPGATGSIGGQGPQGSPGITGATGVQGLQGQQGSPGVTGVTGAQGLQGSPGPTGAVGAQGSPGSTGSQGIQGSPGVTGIQGNQGSPGVTGAIGPQGTQGLPGITGATGIQGPPGATGVQGSPGVTGAVGPQGSPGPTGSIGGQGPQGSPGVTGSIGPQGSQGSPGITGATGIQGQQGSPGVTGSVGLQGNQGSPGSTGPIGPQGSPGVTGATGPQGNQGSPGVTGTIGPQGIQGSPGSTGAIGSQGSPGVTGATGVQGVQGSPGPTGAMGSQGIQGSPGVTGPMGSIGATGSIGSQGIQGSPGVTGAVGPQGATGTIGATGPQGPPGPGGSGSSNNTIGVTLASQATPGILYLPAGDLSGTGSNATGPTISRISGDGTGSIQIPSGISFYFGGSISSAMPSGLFRFPYAPSHDQPVLGAYGQSGPYNILKYGVDLVTQLDELTIGDDDSGARPGIITISGGVGASGQGSGTVFQVLDTSNEPMLNLVSGPSGTSSFWNNLTINQSAVPTFVPYSQSVTNVLENVNSFSQIYAQNFNNGNNASTDFVATADNGSNSSGYIDLGINSSQFAGSIGNPNDSYLYASNKSIIIGTLENTPTGAIKFITQASGIEQVRINNDGGVQIGGPFLSSPGTGTLKIQNAVQIGNGSGSMKFGVQTGATGYALAWPNAIGPTGGILQTNASGILSWATGIPTGPINAFSNVIATGTVPQVGTSISLAIAQTSWMSPGQIVFVGGVQYPQFVQGNSNAINGTTSLPVTLNNTVAVGDLIVVSVNWINSVTVNSLTDTIGNTYSLITSNTTTFSGPAILSVYYTISKASGSNTITAAFSGTAAFSAMRVCEYSGVNTVDQFNSGITTSGNIGNSGNITTTHSTELLFGTEFSSGNELSPPSGWVDRIVDGQEDVNSEQVVSSTGTYVYNPGVNATNICIIVSFYNTGNSIGPGNYFQVQSVPSSADAILLNTGIVGGIPGTSILPGVLVVPAGVPGATGATGPQGATGTIGPQGATGIQGVTGPFGGPQGPTGPTGPQGVTGPAGLGAIPFSQSIFTGVVQPTGTTFNSIPSSITVLHMDVTAWTSWDLNATIGVTGGTGSVGAPNQQVAVAVVVDNVSGPVTTVNVPSGIVNIAASYNVQLAPGYHTGYVQWSRPTGFRLNTLGLGQLAAIGYEGVVGSTGPTGPIGPTGSIGVTGPQGATGPFGGPAGATGPTGPQGPQGVTGPFGGPAGPPGAYTGTIGVPTTLWQPTGFSGANLTSWLSTTSTASGSNTGVPQIYQLRTNSICDVNTTVLGINGQNGYSGSPSGVAKIDLNATFIRGASAAGLLGFVAVTAQRYSLQASGWSANLIATGTNFAVIVSNHVNVPSGVTGTTNWSILSQLNERQF